LTGSDGRL